MGNIKILKASAGSGKTYQLAYAYIRNVIRDPGRYRHILAVTFTNKATEEMKQRIISEINRLACGAPDGYLPELVRDLELPPDTIRRRAREARTRILHDYSHFTIVTIDKFFQRIIRSFIKELGIDINFNLELQTDPLLDTAADRLIEAIATDDKLRKWIVRFAEEQIDRNGKWDVRSEIVALGRELFREQYKTLQSEPVTPEKLTAVVGEAIARSRAVKDEMRRTASEALAVIADAGLRPEDFAYGRQGCTGYLTRINNGEIVPYGKRVQDALGSDDKWVSAKSPHRAKILSLVPQLRGLFGRLCETFDRNFRFLNTTRLLQTNYRSFALLNNLNEKIAEVCAEQHLIPISETNSIINKLIAGNDTPFIYEKTGNTFSHFMIDEFQDTSSQQWQNFVPLLENAVAQQDEFPVLLVGDVKQSIYRWRGGDWQILGRKVREAFGQIAEQTLDTNYRSSGTIVAFNNNPAQGGRYAGGSLQRPKTKAAPRSAGRIRPDHGIRSAGRRNGANAGHRNGRRTATARLRARRHRRTGTHQRPGRSRSQAIARLQGLPPGHAVLLRRRYAGSPTNRQLRHRRLHHRRTANRIVSGRQDPHSFLQPLPGAQPGRTADAGRERMDRPVAAAFPRRSVQRNRPFLPARGEKRRDRLHTGAGRTDPRIRNFQDRRYPAFPAMVGRIGTHPIDPPAAQPRRHQYHHDTQVQRTAVQSRMYSLL